MLYITLKYTFIDKFLGTELINLIITSSLMLKLTCDQSNQKKNIRRNK